MTAIVSGALLLNGGLANAAAFQEPENEAEQSSSQAQDAEQAEPAPGDWVKEYLANELQYSDDEIKEFKSNVAEMPREQLEQLLRRLKFATMNNVSQASVSDKTQRRNLQRMQAAKTAARQRGRPQGPVLRYGVTGHRSYSRWYHAPGNVGLYRGYITILGSGNGAYGVGLPGQ
jgi:hypothetical protein